MSKCVRTCGSNSRVLGSVSCFYTYLRVSNTVITLLLVHAVHSRQRKDALCLSARKRARGASAGASPIGARTIARALALCARASRPRASGVWRLALSLSRARPWSETSSASRRHPSSTAAAPRPSSALFKSAVYTRGCLPRARDARVHAPRARSRQLSQPTHHRRGDAVDRTVHCARAVHR